MARPVSRRRRRRLAFFTSVATLAAWRWRQQWFLLLVAGVGTIVAVMMACALPLFSSVMFTSALRATVSTPPGPQMLASVQTAGFSTSLVNQANTVVVSHLQRHLGAYMSDAPDLDVETQAFEMQMLAGYTLSLYGAPTQTAASHLHLLQGRLPGEEETGLEIALSPEVLHQLHLQVGSTLTLLSIGYTGAVGTYPTPSHFYLQIPLHVVGSFEVKTDDPYWHGQDFGLGNLLDGSYPVVLSGLVSLPALLHYFDHVAQANSSKAVPVQ